ncbi:hypothetical protein C5167_009123 [Papaver somniferum]|uniref:Transcription factor TFIIIC triple barrel domain-containing protein n=1 Tax=Papaver somniferum TaxID=3469 RepID=A0A4Y7K0E6_PAPSO|nr:uncharacterized protein LOC113287688 [Papaver somniferum]RZC65435.1 hypothetical protein C5167_009123 [Papaver somniferum]
MFTYYYKGVTVTNCQSHYRTPVATFTASKSFRIWRKIPSELRMRWKQMNTYYLILKLFINNYTSHQMRLPFYGLDTLNPVLIVGDNLKLIGTYEETIATCLIFSEKDGGPVVHEETGPSDQNLFKGTCIVDPNQTSAKQVKPITSLQKILKFRLASEVDIHDPAVK